MEVVLHEIMFAYYTLSLLQEPCRSTIPPISFEFKVYSFVASTEHFKPLGLGP